MPVLLRALKFVRRYRWQVLAAMLLVGLATGVNMLLPYIWGVIINRLTEVFGVEAALQAQASSTNADDIWHFVLSMSAILAGIYAVGYIIGYIRSRILLTIGNRVVFDIRQQLFRHLQRLSLRYFESHPHGWIMSRVLSDVERVQSILSDQLVNIASQIITLLMALTILYVYNWHLALIATLALPIYVVNFLVLRRRIRRLSHQERDQYARVYSTLSEAISGVRVIKSFGRELWEGRRFVKEIRESITININLGIWRAVLGINANFVTQVANLTIILAGSYEIIYLRTLRIGDLVAILSYAGMLYSPVIALVTISDLINWAMAAIERIFETLDSVPSVQEPEQPEKLGKIEGHVEMRNLYFSYEPSRRDEESLFLLRAHGNGAAGYQPGG